VTDERIDRGMRALLELRARRLAAGERPIGWKLGFGAPAALERLGTSAPLVGFLTDRSLVEPGATVSVAGWGMPMLEPELAIHVGDDLGIGALGPAIELADLDAAVADPEAILAGNIFHRAVVLGAGRHASVAELSPRIERNGDEVAAPADPQELTGELGALLRHLRELLPRYGEELRPGDVVIAGSIVPPLQIVPGDRIYYAVSPADSLELAIASER
jgi:2-keto-4-pentenoate hydratase